MPKQTLQQFGASIKAKHPEYRDMDDEAVGKAVLAKYPQYSDMVDAENTGAEGPILHTSADDDPLVRNVSDLISGGVKGFRHTLNSTDDWARAHLPAFLTNTNLGFGKPADLAAEHQAEVPENTAERLGYGGEQVGEFLLPTGLEKGAAKLGGELLGHGGEIAGKILGAGGHSGLINKAQGGEFGTGALLGAGGTGAGELLKAASPYVTEIAQGIHSPGAKTGKAILNETSGVLPNSIRGSAQNVLDELNPRLNAAADESPALIPMAPARQAATDQIMRAQAQNQPRLIKGVTKMGNQLMERDFTPGLGEGPSATLPIPEEVPARDYLELRRGIGKALPAGSWSPESSNAFKGPRNAIYGTMTNEFHNAVPETAELDRRISSLIPATDEPKNFFFGHALGPGVGGVLGGVGGYRRGVGPEGTDLIGGLKEGALGALSGATAGYIAPAAMNAFARIGYSPATQRLIPAATGSLLQDFDRKDQQ